MSFVTVTVTDDGAVQPMGRVFKVCIARDDFKEADHPRAGNGQFGAGGTVHVVTVGRDGDSEIRGVTDDEVEASDLRDEIEDEEDDDGVERHEVEFERIHDGPVNAVHVLHSGDGSGGTAVHSAYDDAAIAQNHAVVASREAWQAFGPERGDIDRDHDEEDEAVEQWNDEHAADDGALSIKTTAWGDVDRDADGSLQWIQDGKDVEPDDEDRAAFDAHFDQMFPAAERAAYPGFGGANEHFEAEGDHENVFRVHRHDIG